MGLPIGVAILKILIAPLHDIEWVNEYGFSKLEQV